MSWFGRSAADIAKAVRTGKTTAMAVIDEHLAVIAARNDTIGAFRRIRAEEAAAEAQAVQKRPDLANLPLAGVPVAIKDNIAIAGEAARNGSGATSDAPAEADHPVVARLREAGAVVVGITNVPEFCLAGATDNPYGIARNPRDLSRTPGGSSGGSAAAVAAGMVPLAHGTDGLGSLRIPAAACGVTAIKPGPDLVPPVENTWFGLTESGPIAATVADLALGLSVMTGREYRVGGLDAPDDLRIAVAPQPLPVGFRMDPEFRAAAVEAAETLRTAGHTVVEHAKRYPVVLGLATIATWYAAAASEARGFDPHRLEPRTRALARAGRLLTALRLDGTQTRERWRAYGADQWFGDVDVLVTPTVATVPPRADRSGRHGLLRTTLRNVTFAPATGEWNLAGWPALSVPFGTHSSGMPIGVQLIAPPGGESHLLNLAAQLESARPWKRHASIE
ncbi:amidase family protein [Thermopolyspora sp. NPDC052614]|uniref:amidase n=1 Tax=Thermopolyspora sp. NPDC052614 TaxID=3155682 RepID=UPI003417D986